MLVINDVLISDDIIEENFQCNLNACKGACCWEGDYGAPVDASEMKTITENLDIISKELSDESLKLIKNSGPFTYYKEPKVWGTTCHSNGECVFLTTNEIGISICGIEKSWQNEQQEFQKPISCHLYPIRISKNNISGFEAWNYDRWDICSAACEKGKENKMPIYKFVKNAIIRKKGRAFYEELEAAAQHFMDSKD
jgi:Fe-S-cluster containining protein